MRDEIIDILNMICPTFDTDDEEISLIESLDAKEMADFIAELEAEFDIEISDDEQNDENFESVDTVITLIKRLQ